MEKLQTKLFEAATQNSISSLHQLLKEDQAILERSFVNRFNETPLHVAAMFGHVEFVQEIIRLQPQLVNQLNSQLSSPLHLAAAKGHVGVVKALLSVDSRACLARDSNELLPLHLAAVKGHVEAMEVLLEARPEAAKEKACGGESVLHLCVKSYQLEALKLIVKSVGNDGKFINSGDSDGNTALHLAVAEKQVQVVKFLVSVGAVEVNAQNDEGLTAMDVLMGSRRDVRDSEIEYLLTNGDKPPKKKPKKNSWDGLMKQHAVWLEKEKQTLMVVASLIATMAFQAGVNPPDGLWKKDDYDPDAPVPPSLNRYHSYDHSFAASYAPAPSPANQYRSYYRVIYVRPVYFPTFYVVNTTAFIASLSIILLLTSGLPMRRRFFMWILMVITWIAITAIAGSYILVIKCLKESAASEDDEDEYVPFGVGNAIECTVYAWAILMFLLLLGHTIRMIVKLVKKVRNGWINWRMSAETASRWKCC